MDPHRIQQIRRLNQRQERKTASVDSTAWRSGRVRAPRHRRHTRPFQVQRRVLSEALLSGEPVVLCCLHYYDM